MQRCQFLGLLLAFTPIAGVWAGTLLPAQSDETDILEHPFVAAPSFALPTLRSLAPDFLAGETEGPESLVVPDTNNGSAYQSRLLGLHSQNNSFYIPLYRSESTSSRLSETNEFQAWGVKWKHRWDADNSFALSAHLGENTYKDTEVELGSTTSTMAAVSWTRQLSGGKRPSVTGSVFYGDEIAASENELQFYRKYFGVTFGGQFTVYDNHTPYVSLKLQKSDYDIDETLNWQGFDANHFSRLSAGWNWQVQNNWSLKAEANYVVQDSELDWRFDRSNLFFGTRYDFR